MKVRRLGGHRRGVHDVPPPLPTLPASGEGVRAPERSTAVRNAAQAGKATSMAFRSVHRTALPVPVCKAMHGRVMPRASASATACRAASWCGRRVWGDGWVAMADITRAPPDRSGYSASHTTQTAANPCHHIENIARDGQGVWVW